MRHDLGDDDDDGDDSDKSSGGTIYIPPAPAPQVEGDGRTKSTQLKVTKSFDNGEGVTVYSFTTDYSNAAKVGFEVLKPPPHCSSCTWTQFATLDIPPSTVKVPREGKTRDVVITRPDICTGATDWDYCHVHPGTVATCKTDPSAEQLPLGFSGAFFFFFFMEGGCGHAPCLSSSRSRLTGKGGSAYSTENKIYRTDKT